MSLRPRLRFVLPTFVLLLVAACASLICTSATHAQQPSGIQNAWAALADQPASHTAFSFDRTMMQVAQALLQSGGMSSERAAAALTGISVDNYHYSGPAFYTPEAMSAIIASYRAAGWKHLVNANQSPESSAQPRGVITDLWLHNSGPNIGGVVVLTRAPRDMSVIQITCDLRPLDLVHLSGHFGIPKVDPNAVMVPAPDGR
ncbi:MAG TPA: hypothetical protein VGG18_07500 [Granulicella sp.]